MPPLLMLCLTDVGSCCVLQMEVWHVGSFRFKGLPEPMHVMHLGNSLVNGRVFPSHTPSKKAERVAPALGLQCIVGVPAFT